MILSEKIMSLRKQNGWSQENLADQLDVSRQSVSKWESGISIPDIDKIIKMSELFNVTTDYLLKESDDEFDVRKFEGEKTQETVPLAEELPGREISVEFATDYMDTVASIAKRFAFAVALCVMSPILLVLLSTMEEAKVCGVTEAFASGLGVSVLLLLVAGATVIFVLDGMKLSKFDFLEKEKLVLKYGVEVIVNRKREAFDAMKRMMIAIGVVLCIVGVIPLVVAGAMDANDLVAGIMVCVLLTFCSVATFLFVYAGMNSESFKKLLQEEEYSLATKEKKAKDEGAAFAGSYWCLVTAVYLVWSFVRDDWGHSWLIWAVAGLLFVPCEMVAKAIMGNKENKQN